MAQTLKKCPHCNSKNIYKRGKLAKGGQKYVCKACGKNFSVNTIIREPITEVCPVCGSAEVRRSGKGSTGNRRYICRSCGKKFTENVPVVYERYKAECPLCHSKEAKKGGKSPKGSQYYICCSCNHKFLEDGVFSQITSKQKLEACLLWEQGCSVQEVSEKLGKSERTIKNAITSVYKKKMEELGSKKCMSIAMYRVNIGLSSAELSESFKVPKGFIDYISRKYQNKEAVWTR